MHDLRIDKKLAWPGSEDSLHMQCMSLTKKELLRRGLPQIAHHCPSGGNRSQREAGKFKLLGVLPGVPDIFIPLRTKDHSGLYIELKNAKGKVSPSQIEYMEAVAKEGFLCLVVNDLETYQQNVIAYLNEHQNQ